MPYRKHRHHSYRKHKGLKNAVRKLEKKVKLIDTSIERKNIDLEATGSLSAIVPFPATIHNCVDLADLGPDVNERIGNKITGRQVQVRATLSLQPTTGNAIVRLLVVRWINNQDLPVAADVNFCLDYDTPAVVTDSLKAINCPYMINSDKKYRILDDRVFKMQDRTLSANQFYRKSFTLKGKAQEMTFENVTPAREDPSNNQISVFILNAAGTPAPAAAAGVDYYITTRLYYNDL